MRSKRWTLFRVGVVAASSLIVWACVGANPATDTGDPGFPFGPSTHRVRPLAYVQDIKPIFDATASSATARKTRAGTTP